jgi:hypothetical protein
LSRKEPAQIEEEGEEEGEKEKEEEVEKEEEEEEVEKEETDWLDRIERRPDTPRRRHAGTPARNPVRVLASTRLPRRSQGGSS